MTCSFQIIEKPEWVTWDEIHRVLWVAHSRNRENGINMIFPSLPGDEIREKIEGHGIMFVAIADGKVVGTAAIIVRNLHLWCGMGEFAYFCFASVLPEFEGYGIYKQLNIAREEKARELGLNRIKIDTHESNSHLLNIAKKVGYKNIDIHVAKDHYNVVLVKWLYGCPYSEFYCRFQFLLHKYYRKLRFKPGRIKRFGI